MKSLTDLVPDDFRSLTAPLTLEVRIGDNHLTMELAVESVTARPAHEHRAEPFSLVLQGPHTPLLPQATYPLKHPTLGFLEIFLVPISRDAAATRYEATFN